MRILGLLLLAASTAWPQVSQHANEGYQTAQDRQRLIRVLSSPDRPEQLRAGKLVQALELSPGATVVDLGTGAGVLLPYLSRAVGPSGKVIAEDIHEDFLDAARKTARKEKLENVEYLLGGVKDPNLPENSADAIVAVDAYHHFSYPEEMLAGIRKGLKDGGRFVVVDYYKNGFRDPDHIRLDKPGVIKEIESNGFRLVENREHVPETQYMLVFEKR